MKVSIWQHIQYLLLKEPMTTPLHDTHQKIHPLQVTILCFENLLTYLTTSDLNDYTYLNMLAYIEKFIGFKPAHDYDYHSYAE